MTPYDSKKYWKTICHTEWYKVKNRNPLKSVKFTNSNLSGQNFSFFLLLSEMIKYDQFIEFQTIYLVHLLSVIFAVNLKWNKEVFLYLINSLAYKLTMTLWHANLAVAATWPRGSEGRSQVETCPQGHPVYDYSHKH